MTSVRGRLEAALGAAIRSEPRFRHVQSVVASLHGETVAELYLRGRRRDDRSNVHSVTKGVLATLTGIAIRDRALSLDTPIAELVADAIPADDRRKRLITVEHLLTMTAGLDCRTPYDIDDIADRRQSLLAGPLAAPLTSDPGMEFSYNNGAAHVLGIAVASATGSSLLSFAGQRLFAPLGIEDYRWPTDPEGNVLGWGHLELRPLDLLKLGELYRSGGRFGGRDVLDPGFVAAATRAASLGGPPEGHPYGYLWWIAEDAGYPSYFAGGFAGQYATVVPELGLVVATTGDAAVFIPTSADSRSLVSSVVIPVVRR